MLEILTVLVAETVVIPLLGVTLAVLTVVGWRRLSVAERLLWPGVLMLAAVSHWGTGEYARAFSTWLID